MRRLALSALLLVAACDGGESPAERAEAAKTAANGIECALAGAEAFARQCTVEAGERGAITIHHPDGGFRRVRRDGEALVPIDGADQGQVERLPDGGLLWSIDRDRYRIPRS